MEHLTDFERDQLIEVVNIGAGNASTALSQMVEKKITIHVPDVFVDRVERVPQFFGETEKIMTVVLLKLLGDAPGIMLLMFPPESALKLAGLLTKQHKKNIKVLDELDRSALREVGNILSGASMTALSKFLDLNVLQSVPDAATDMLGSVVDTVLAEIGKESDIVLVFKVNFSIEGEDIDGQLFFLFDPKATAKILEATNKVVGRK
ncbi:chemotaxis protein CheC [Patescibacteria group bacterium AH-259-L07]|nr:chemotaxis protein CheC [Patescibacteria group bacterium AH-259-L07]